MRCGQAPWNSSKSRMRRGLVSMLAQISSGVPTTSAVCRVRPWNGTSTHCVGNLRLAEMRLREIEIVLGEHAQADALAGGASPALSTMLWWQPSSRPRR